MKIHGGLLLIILVACDTCNCKCDEYIVVMKQIDSPEIQPMKTDVLNELISFYNATGLYNDVDSFKDCIIEMECQGYQPFCPRRILPTNRRGEHSEEPKNSTMDEKCKTGDDKNECNQKKADLINNEDQSVYNLNIIYVNKNDIRNDADLIDNHTKNTMFMVVCDYAENACDDFDGDATNLNNYRNISNDVALNKTMEELNITLKRDEDSVIQPIFTGFATQNLTTGSSKNTPLEVTFTCKYKESTQCKRKANNLSEEIVTVPSTSINVYLINDYVQNGTKTKYTDCKKVSDDTNNTFNIQCEGTNFTSNNRDVLFSFPISSNHNETFNLHCQVSESYLSTEAKQSKDVLNNEYNLLNFNNCYSNQNVSDRTDFERQNVTLFLKSRRGIDNITINDGVEINETDFAVTTTEDKININKDNLFKIHITTHNINNCSQNKLFSITEGQIIDKGNHFFKEDIPEYNDVELKLLNCLNETYPFKNNTKANAQTKLKIIFENDTDIKTDKELDEPTESMSILLICNPFYHDEHKPKIASLDDKVFVCESKAMNNNTTMKIYSSDMLPNETKEIHTINSNTGNRSDINEENKDNNCSFKATDKTHCAPKCDTENVDGCNNVSLTGKKNNESIDNNKYNLQVGSKTNDSQIKGSDNLSIESGDSLERISLILLVSVAGSALVIALVLRKCAQRGVYRPAPQRDPQDYEDTAF